MINFQIQTFHKLKIDLLLLVKKMEKIIDLALLFSDRQNIVSSSFQSNRHIQPFSSWRAHMVQFSKNFGILI